MIRSILVILFTLLCVTVSAQEIYLCKSHTEDGKPIDAGNSWNISPWGTYITILYDNGSKPIKDDLMFVFIDKKMSGKYQPYDSEAIKIEERRNWISFNHKFTERGEYRVYAVDSDQKELASIDVKIGFNEIVKKQENTRNGIYFNDSRVVFCENVFGGKPYGVKDEISLSGDKGKFYMHIKNGAPINTDTLLVDIWKQQAGSSEFNEFIESKKFLMDSSWASVFFKLKLNSPGQYKISVFTDREVMLINGYIYITN
ncbi:MAG: hypothetical protein K9J16_17005 [Melioribacteraceae bacterium]|nr:hypothetical protein [Melioribacteraceae bacterium]MCF8356123.1 hypothetical protein [Melioribacteraceae bacterium]MCF8395905.1 hypothetical protein [Melioribacteraceae bacterium]MCF8420988.1 hypothetical protein [Melioribacteraceae bacterium]